MGSHAPCSSTVAMSVAREDGAGEDGAGTDVGEVFGQLCRVVVGRWYFGEDDTFSPRMSKSTSKSMSTSKSESTFKLEST